MRITKHTNKLIIFYIMVVIYMTIIKNIDKYINTQNIYISSISIEFFYILFLIICNHYLFKLKIRNKLSNDSIIDKLVYITPILIYSYLCILTLLSYKGAVINILFTLCLTILVSFYEEVFFRGIILGYLIFDRKNKTLIKKNKNHIFYSLIISSIIFSLSHVSNYINANMNISIVLPQLVFTFSIGLILGIQYIRSGNLISSIFLHFLVDIPSILYLSHPLQHKLDISKNIIFNTKLKLLLLFLILCMIYTLVFINNNEKNHYKLVINN